MTGSLRRQVLASLITIGLILASQSALAHAQFRDSSPASDTTLDTSPHEIVLNFSQAVTPVTVTLVGPDGNTVDTGSDAQGNGVQVVLAVPDPLSPGAYVVSFRVLSGDAHPISGGFRFAIAGPIIADDPSTEPVVTQPASPSTSVATEAVEPPDTNELPLELLEQGVRAVFIGLVLLGVGLIIFQALVPLPGSLREWLFGLVRRVGWIGIVAAIGYFLVATLAVTGVEAFRARHLYVVLQTSIGMSLLLAMIGFLFLTMSAAQQRILMGIAAALLIISRVATGHPASQEPMLLLIPSMAIHVATAGFWFASLWVLLRLLRKGPLADAPQILESFAKAAMWSVAALLAVGVLMAAIHLKSFEALFSSTYGITLLWKLGGVTALLAFATVNKFWLTPQLADEYDAGKLKTSIRLEAVVMLVVIVISTVLAAAPPIAKRDEVASASPASIVSVASETGNYTLIVDFSSQKYDEMLPLSMELVNSAGNPFTPLEVSLTVTIPSRRIEALPLTITQLDGNHVVVEADFPNVDDTYFEALVLVTDFNSEQFVFDRGGRLER